MTEMTQNYRESIKDIILRHSVEGEDIESSILSGSPAVIDASCAESIALWLETNADTEWGKDPRYTEIAKEIRQICFFGPR